MADSAFPTAICLCSIFIIAWKKRKENGCPLREGTKILGILIRSMSVQNKTVQQLLQFPDHPLAYSRLLIRRDHFQFFFRCTSHDFQETPPHLICLSRLQKSPRQLIQQMHIQRNSRHQPVLLADRVQPVRIVRPAKLSPLRPILLPQGLFCNSIAVRPP